jgi:hypothetical protein
MAVAAPEGEQAQTPSSQSAKTTTPWPATPPIYTTNNKTNNIAKATTTTVFNFKLAMISPGIEKL